MAEIATTLRFVLLGDDKASPAFQRFARQVEQSSKAADRNSSALKKQQEQQDRTSKSLTGLIGSVSGFGDVATAASSKSSIFARTLAAVNVATGVAEPALAGLVVAVGGAAAAYTSAAAGALAYKLALTPLLKEATDAAAAQKKLGDAQTKAQITYQAALASGAKQKTAEAARVRALATAQKQYTAAVKGTPPSVLDFAKALKTTQDAYKAWANRLSAPVLAPLQAGLALVKPALHDISPLVLAAAKALGILEFQFAKFVDGGGLTRVVQTLLPHVQPAILGLGHSIANIAVGLGGIVRAFLPMADTVTRGVTSLTAKFRDWATSLPSHTGFQSLMSTFRNETPLATAVLKNLAQIIKNVAAATVGLASPANSKALLQILTPLSQIMVRLTANAGLVRSVLYFTLLAGSLRKVSGAFGAVKTGVGSISSLVAVTQKAYGVAGRFAGGYQNAALAASAFSGTAGTLGGKLAGLVAKGGATAAMLVSLAGPLGVAAAAIGVLALATHGFKATQDKLGASIDAQVKAAGYSAAAYGKMAQQTDILGGSSAKTQQALRAEAGSLGDTSLAAKVAGIRVEFLSRVHTAAAMAAANLSQRLGTLADAYDLSQAGAAKLAAKAGVSARELAAGGSAGQAAFRKIVAYAGGAGQAAVQSIRLTTAQNALKTSLDRVNSGLLTGQQSLLAWQQAQKSALQAINASSTGLRGQTSAALNAKQAVLASTQAAIDLANAESRQQGGMGRASQTIRDQIRFLQQHGDKSKFARQEVDALRQALALLHSKKLGITVSGTGSYTVNAPGTGGKRIVSGQWTGGQIRGPGGPTDDQAGLFALSDKEWVIQARSSTKYGDKAMAAVNRGTATILHPGMAAGGSVSGTYAGNPKGLGAFDVREYNATVKAIEDATARATAKAVLSGGGWGQGSGRKLVNYLRPYVGHVPYVWGGTSPAGWDCSGMTLYGLKHANGITAPRTSEAQWAWTRHTNDQVGALAFFVSPAGGAPPGHVGVSMGNGLMINAAGTLSGTTISGTGGSMGFGVPPGMAAGGKVSRKPVDPQQQRWLNQLARDVKVLAADEKAAAKRRKVLRQSLAIDELWFLTHPNVRKGGIGWNEHEKALRASRHRLSAFNQRETAKETVLGRKIALLRLLTHYPKGKMYGGPGVPAPAGDGSGGGSTGGLGGGDTGGGTAPAPSGPPPIPPPPMPAWMIAAGLGGPAAPGGSGLVAAMMARRPAPWRARFPVTDPIASRGPYSWGGGQSMGYGGGWGGGQGTDYGEVIAAIRAMHQDVVGAVGRVAPGTTRGLDESLNRRVPGIAARFS